MMGLKRQYRSKKHKDKSRRKLLVWGSVGFGVSILILAGLVYLVNIEEFQISEVQVSGNSVVETDEIVKVVEEMLEGRYLSFVPHSNSFFAPRREIRETLKESFPRFRYVDVLYESTNVLKVQVEERSSVAIWCGETFEDEEVESCYFVDSEAVVYAPAPSFSGDVFLRIYAPKDGDTIMSAEDIKTVLAIGRFLNEGEGEVSAFTLESEEDGVFDIATFIDGSEIKTSILVSLKENADASMRNLSTLLEVEGNADIKKPQVYHYEYIDLRFGEKVYFKERPHLKEL